MDRRYAGLLLMLVAVLAVGVVPNVLGKAVGGSPVAATIADPPVPGQCVVAIDPAGAASGRSAQGTTQPTTPVATIVAGCRGPVIGEVMSVRPATTTPAISTLDEYEAGHPDCRSQVEPYLGTTSETDIGGVQWYKSLSVNAVTVGPTARERAAGRTWAACVIAAVAQSYPGPWTLRSAWAAGRLPDAFGLCWAAEVVQHGTATPCTEPHVTQQLAYGFVPAPSDSSTGIVSMASGATVVAGCRTIAANILGVADPTVGGQLAVTVVSGPPGAPYVQCAVAVTGGRKLVGSVIALRNKPLPLA